MVQRESITKKPLTADGKIEGLVNNETVDFKVTGSQTEVGNSKNTYTLKWTGTAKKIQLPDRIQRDRNVSSYRKMPKENRSNNNRRNIYIYRTCSWSNSYGK